MEMGKNIYKYSDLLLKLGVVAVLVFAIVPVQWQNRRIHSHVRAMHLEVETMKKQVRSYQNEIHALKTDPNYVEYLLRQELHYGYKDEYILMEKDDGRDR